MPEEYRYHTPEEIREGDIEFLKAAAQKKEPISANWQYAARLYKLITGKEVPQDEPAARPEPENQRLIELIKECGETAKRSRFWEAHNIQARQLIRKEIFGHADELPDEVADEFEYNTAAGDTLYAENVGDVIDRCVDILEEKLVVGDPVIFMALMVSEIGEAIEAYRHGMYVGKDGVAEELADVVIRLFDFVARFGPRLGFEPEDWVGILMRKMEYNKQRPPLHGKKF